MMMKDILLREQFGNIKMFLLMAQKQSDYVLSMKQMFTMIRKREMPVG